MRKKTEKTVKKQAPAKKPAVAPKKAAAAVKGVAPAKTVAPSAPRGESRTALVRRARRINRELAEVFPYAHPELDFENPFQLVVATVLSAQTTDLRVNQTTPGLFAKYPTPEDLAAADPEKVEEILRPTGFFRAKTKSVIGLSKALAEDFGGEVPGRLEDLVKLPGVGRKTAFVVLGNAFGRPGITVDTHFQRLVRRWRWTAETDPDKIEAAVGALFPKSDWTDLSHHVIWHGRRICHARKPRLRRRPIAPLCPAYGEGETDPEKAKKLLKYEKGGFPGQRLNPRRPIWTRAGNRHRRWGRPGDGTISVASGVGIGRTGGGYDAGERHTGADPGRDPQQGGPAGLAGPGGAGRRDGAPRPAEPLSAAGGRSRASVRRPDPLR